MYQFAFARRKKDTDYQQWDFFINEIREIRPPHAKEMHQLKYQVQERNRYVRERVIQMHLKFAVQISLQRAEQYDCEIADMLQDACLGLINAVDRFEPDMSGPFGSYASLWIQEWKKTFVDDGKEPEEKRQII